MLKNNLLKRYWIILHPENKFGHQNIGVTAFSANQAKKIVLNNSLNLNWLNLSPSLIDCAEIIENIDVTLLDQNHVIPNMGPVIFEGIWFPKI